MYVPHESSSETCIRRKDHNECPTAYTKTLAVISLSGKYTTPNSFLMFYLKHPKCWEKNWVGAFIMGHTSNNFFVDLI